MSKYNEAWVGFVRELRRQGYWSDPEKYKDLFEAYFEPYFEGDPNHSLAWYLGHCLDNAHLDGDGPWWDEWTDEDRKKVEEECARLSGVAPHPRNPEGGI